MRKEDFRISRVRLKKAVHVKRSFPDFTCPRTKSHACKNKISEIYMHAQKKPCMQKLDFLFSHACLLKAMHVKPKNQEKSCPLKQKSLLESHFKIR
jgi:hypothetical protein